MMIGRIVLAHLFALAFVPTTVTAQSAAVQVTGVEILHLVEPGDTWQALSWRYGVPVEAIQQANPHPNVNRQPAIGQTVMVPEPARVQRNGIIVNSRDGGLLQLSAATAVRPWSIALVNKLNSPYRPLLYRSVFLDVGYQPPRQLPAGLLSLEVSRAPGQPGQALAIRGLASIDSMVTARFSGNQFHIARQGSHFVAVIGTGAFFPPGQYDLDVSVAGQPGWSQPWLIVPGEWTFEEVTYTGAAAAISGESIRLERERLAETWSQYDEQPYWIGQFSEPLESYLDISSRYGARRSYNGGPYDRYHEGLDFSAYGGTPVIAPAAGIIVLAEELTARGGAVIINHGLGIYSGYYHLSEVVAVTGSFVSAGDNIGLVGSTGLSTGNHLHWDFLISGTWVDPAGWLEMDLACWLLQGWGAPCQK